ncbi:hypothetical protein QQ008_23750 [Fulvivirgaceae bacterium BMA10]|uniref:Uncharacterized protein n=2 Tax=Splendidivirga corallicola TaxID=3051826 RepID=A0ABT8KWB1_9BACT|nr:hypothetical protein [Fulvivirgaceae bacterium BMA10]
MAYVILVYFMFTLMRKRNLKTGEDNNDDDGGIDVPTSPKIDLPPGISLPSDGPYKKIEEPEEMMA